MNVITQMILIWSKQQIFAHQIFQLDKLAVL